MSRAIITICFIILTAFVCQTTQAAENKFFYSDGNIMPGEQWENVLVYNNGTTVNMSGGTVDGIGTHNASTLNISGGNASTVEALDFSTINVTGGNIYGLMSRNNGIITLSGDAYVGSLVAYDFGTILINSGLIDFLSAAGNGKINLYGGKINDSLSVGESTIVNIYGNDLVKIQTGGRFGFGYVHGFWHGSEEFTIDLTGSDTYSHINLVPEPMSLLLFGCSAIILRRKR